MTATLPGVPVLICGASTTVGRQISQNLLDEGGEVRLFSVGDVAALRQQGAFVSHGTWDDEGRLEAALTDVHTLVFVPHGLAWPADRITAAASVCATAATNAGVKRVIMVSALGASRSREAHRVALAEAERHLALVPAPTLIMRSNLVQSPRLIDALLTADLDGLDEVRVTPITVEDVAGLVGAFDQARADSRDGTLVVRCEGATAMPFGAYRSALRQRYGAQGRVGRRLLRPSETSALQTFIADGFHDDEADVDGFTLAGLHPSTSV